MKTKVLMILIPAVFAAFAAAAWLGEVSVDLAFDPPVVAQEADYIAECGRSALLSRSNIVQWWSSKGDTSGVLKEF